MHRFVLFCLFVKATLALYFSIAPGFFVMAEQKNEKISKIIIEGNRIIETPAITSKIKSQKGDVFQQKTVSRDLKTLFETGWFEHIEVYLKQQDQGGVTLIYRVKEKPVIQKITYHGNKSINKKKLDKILEIAVYEIIDFKKIRASLKKIKEEYQKKGFYLTKVSYQMIPSKKQKNHSELKILIEENKKARVKRIYFSGNKEFSDKELKSVMAIKTQNLLSFLSSAGSYNQEMLDRDVTVLQLLYLNKGYLTVQIDKPRVFISPDQKDISMFFHIKEGARFRVGSVDFSGDLLFPKEELAEGLKTKPYAFASQGRLRQDMDYLQTRYGDLGYAFVNILPKMYNLPTDDKQTVHIMFDIQKGNQVTIGQIPIYGNHRTRDKVIRRELRVFEGRLYNETNKKLSEINLNRLQFFENVKITPRTHRNRDDLIDLEVRVQERENVGVLEGGVGFDGYDGLRITGKVQNLNLFGLGHTIKLETQLNFRVQHITLDYDVPYFLDSDWHVGGEFNFYRIAEERSLFWNRNRWLKSNCEANIKYSTQKNQSAESKRMKNMAKNRCKNTFANFIKRRGYNEQNISGGFTIGRKLNDWLSLYLTYRWQHLHFYNSIDKSIYPVDEINGLRNPLELIAEFDVRDDRLFPKSGMLSRTSFTYDGVFTKFNYFRFSENLRWYKRLFWEVLFRVNFQYSRLFSFSGLSSDIPFDTWFSFRGYGKPERI